MMNMNNYSCAGCGIEHFDGQNLYGLTRGSIDTEICVFRIDDDSEWEYFCSNCMNIIDQFLASRRQENIT